MKFPIPDSALDDRLAILGTAGSGKTYLALTAIERLLDRKARIVFCDALGVGWGLRLDKDGKRPSRFSIPIFGGSHGDLPLNEHAGALIGETVAKMQESCIVDLSAIGTKAAERRFMLAFLTALYRNATKEPLHLIIDEADMWAPQRLLDKDGDAAKLLGMMETIVRRGRVLGFIPWLITQRPAVLSKDVLSQADGLVALKLTSSQDRDAIGAWIEGQADKSEAKAILASLPGKARGEGVLWIPTRGILDSVSFPEKSTFDSSRTPKRGERRQTAELTPLDLGALKERLATIETEAKANDPKSLKAEVARLQGELRKIEKGTPIATPDSGALERADFAGYKRGKIEGYGDAIKEIAAQHSALSDDVRKAIEALGVVHKNADAIQRWALRAKPDVGNLQRKNILQNIPAAIAHPVERRASIPKVASSSLAGRSNGHAPPIGAERRPLGALASVYPAGMTEAQWAVAAGLKRTGGTWAAYVSRLRTAGRIEKRGDLYYVTEDGLMVLGDEIPRMPAPGPELVEFWAGKISGVGPMLRHLAAIYPEPISRESLADALNMAASGGTFAAYLSRLRTPGLIDVSRDGVRASDALMIGN